MGACHLFEKRLHLPSTTPGHPLLGCQCVGFIVQVFLLGRYSTVN